jgi:branched-chain amino acid transport system ATP-binding protein
MSILELKGVSKAFGGVQAVLDVTLTVQEGELGAIIGPNGAGKSTLFNLITGHYKLDQGQVLFKGKSITGLPPHRVSKLGVGRAFQGVTIFPTMSVHENILVPLIVSHKHAFNLLSFTRDRKELHTKAMEYLEMVELADKARTNSEELSHGEQMRLEVGIALATEADLLLLDEPTSGMSPGETRDMMKLIKKLCREAGKTIVFTEHDMDVVFGIAQRIRVLHMGMLIADGSPEEISNNEEVKEAYLGGYEVAVTA